MAAAASATGAGAGPPPAAAPAPLLQPAQGTSRVASPSDRVWALRLRADNRYCADCDESDPSFLSLSRGVFLCSQCSAVHRSVLQDQSVRPLQGAAWSEADAAALEAQGGNAGVNSRLEKFVPSKPQPHSGPAERAEYIVNKYQRGRFLQRTKSLDLAMRLGRQGDALAQAMPLRLVDYFVTVGLGAPTADSLDKAFADVQWEPEIEDRFPREDHKDAPLPPKTEFFAFPELMRLSRGPQPPRAFPFVLTKLNGAHIYGYALQIYERLDPIDAARLAAHVRARASSESCVVDRTLSAPQATRDRAGAHSTIAPASVGQTHRLSPTMDADLHVPRALCVVSHWPFFSLYEGFLKSLFRASRSAPPLPLERIVANFVLEVPVPPAGRVSVVYPLADRVQVISRPPPNQLPLLDLPLRTLFEHLDHENIIAVFVALATEQRVVFVSESFTTLVTCIEGFCALLFPFYWQCLYWPVLPIQFAAFLQSPVSFVAGMRASALAQVDCPDDAVRVLLDSNTVLVPSLGALPRIPDSVKRKLLAALAESTQVRVRHHVPGAADIAFPAGEHDVPITNFAWSAGVSVPTGASGHGALFPASAAAGVSVAQVPPSASSFLSLPNAPQDTRTRAATVIGPGDLNLSPSSSAAQLAVQGAPAPPFNPLSPGPPGGAPTESTAAPLPPPPPPPPPPPGSLSSQRHPPSGPSATPPLPPRAPLQREGKNASDRALGRSGGMASMFVRGPAGPLVAGGRGGAASAAPSAEATADGKAEAFDQTRVRNAFLRVWTKLLENYRQFVVPATDHAPGDFQRKDFVAAAPEDARRFLSALVDTQLFAAFVQERAVANAEQSLEVRYFDECIVAKHNRKLLAKAAPTPMLESREWDHVGQFFPPAPDTSGLGLAFYRYERFPRLQESLFGPKRYVRPLISETPLQRTQNALMMLQATQQLLVPAGPSSRDWKHTVALTVRVQSWWRGVRDRRNYARMLRAWRWAAPRILARALGARERLRFRRLRAASVVVQAAARAALASRHRAALAQAAATLQREWRRHRHRAAFHRVRNCIVNLQRRYRRRFARAPERTLLLRSRNAAQALQAGVRAKLAVTKRQRLLEASLVMQAALRSVLARRKAAQALRLREMVALRASLLAARRRTKKRAACALRLQSAARVFLARKHFRSQVEALCAPRLEYAAQKWERLSVPLLYRAAVVAVVLPFRAVSLAVLRADDEGWLPGKPAAAAAATTFPDLRARRVAALITPEALRAEREWLYGVFKTDVSEAERNRLLQLFGVPLAAKRRKQQLVDALFRPRAPSRDALFALLAHSAEAVRCALSSARRVGAEHLLWLAEAETLRAEAFLHAGAPPRQLHHD